MKLYAQQAEILAARHFCWRQNIIVPNLSYGMLSYEADVVVLRPSLWADEVEIKCSAQDIRADLKKPHQHRSRLFKRLWFLVPHELREHPDIPGRAGILAARWNPGRYSGGWFTLESIRAPALNPEAVRWSEKQRLELLRLAHMRVWSLKEHLLERRLCGVNAVASGSVVTPP